MGDGSWGEKCIEQRRRLNLGTRHKVAVEVERDLDRGMAHERRESLGVDARRDHEGGVGMARLVQAQALGQTGLGPGAVGGR